MVMLGGALVGTGVITMVLHIQHWQPCLPATDRCLDVVMYESIPLYDYVMIPVAIVAVGFVFAVWTRRPWMYALIALALLWAFAGAISDPGFGPQYADPGPGSGILAGVGYILLGFGFAAMSRIPRASPRGRSRPPSHRIGGVKTADRNAVSAPTITSDASSGAVPAGA